MAVWQEELRQSVRDAAGLRRAAGAAVAAGPRSGAGRVQDGDPAVLPEPDRLGRPGRPDPPAGAWPRRANWSTLPEERHDPIGDRRWSPVHRLTHRYPDRVLIYPTYLCSMYCRFCFRKERLNEDERGLPARRPGPGAGLRGAPTRPSAR